MTDRGIYRQEDAEKYFKSAAGKSYRPSNGSEGEMFHEAYCYQCARYGGIEPGDLEPCRIQGRMLVYNVGDPEYPQQIIYGRDGQPTCTAFTLDADAPIFYDGPDQLKLFEVQA